MHYPSPQWLAKLMDYIHTWLNKWRMQGNFTKQGDGISPKEGESSVPAKDRRNAWTLGGIAIDQVSKYKYPGVVYQEDGSWQAHAQGAAKMQAAMVLEATAVMQQSADKGQTALMVQTFIYSAVMYGAEVDTTKAVKDKMSAVVKLSSILALHPETALLTFCTGHWATSTGYSLMLPNCVGSTDARTWRLADGPRRRCDSHSRVAVVSAGLRWHGLVR
jgi:hypothetical protein